jgi:hypothetical protein
MGEWPTEAWPRKWSEYGGKSEEQRVVEGEEGGGDDGGRWGLKAGRIGQASSRKLSLNGLNHGSLVGVGLGQGLVTILLAKEVVAGRLGGGTTGTAAGRRQGGDGRMGRWLVRA